MKLPPSLKAKLNNLADKYEVASFTQQDPSQFLRWYDRAPTRIKTSCTELASFIAAMLAFGNRRQFIPKIEFILQTADKTSSSILEWLKTGDYKKTFPCGSTKFYRFYSYNDMQTFFGELADIINASGASDSQDGVLGKFFDSKWEQDKSIALDRIISQSFPKSSLVPKGRSSANKRLHMFLRWMVRTGSPVDLGLWTWYPKDRLIIPLDTHVMQEAQKLGLLPPKATASRKTAETLTNAMAQVFPGDPCRADYALFGLGVDN